MCVQIALMFLCICFVQLLSATPIEDIQVTIDSISSLHARAKKEKDTDTNKAITTMLQAIDLSKSIQHDSLIQRTKNTYSLYLMMQAQYDKSKEIIFDILHLYEEQGRNFHLGILYNRLGYIESKLNNYDQAYEYLIEALKYMPDNRFRHQGISHAYLCDVLVNLGNYQDALAHIEISLELLKKSKSEQYLTMALTELGKLHFKIEDYTQARTVFKQSLRNDIVNDQFKILPTVHLAIIEYKLGHPEEARVYLNDAKNLMLKTGNAYELSTVYLYLSQIENDQANNSTALTLAEKSLQIAKEHQFKKQEQLSKLLLSSLSLERGHFYKAINYCSDVLEYTRTHQDFELQSQAYDRLAEAHARLGNHKQSYHYRTEHQKTNDLYHNSKNIIDVTGKTTKYRLEKEREIEEQSREAELKITKLMRNVVLGFSLLLSIFIFFLSQLNRKRRLAIAQLEKNNLLLQKTETELDAANQQLTDKNKKLESYIEVNLQLENFAHIASHDLKAPLREQASFIQLLEKNTLLTITEKDRSYLSYISRSNSDMQTLIEDMIEYSLIKSDVYKIESINPELIIKKAEYLNRDLIHKEGAKIIIHDMPKHIEADSQKITVVFRNLIHNSLTYAQKGIEPIIEIGCNKKANSYIFYVKDNGQGIHPNVRDDIFEVFKRFSNGVKARGNGLGLAMVKQVIEKHQGQVWLESETKKGSIFYFSIAA